MGFRKISNHSATVHYKRRRRVKGLLVIDPRVLCICIVLAPYQLSESSAVLFPATLAKLKQFPFRTHQLCTTPVPELSTFLHHFPFLST
jgi:hypothetical protein